MVNVIKILPSKYEVNKKTKLVSLFGKSFYYFKNTNKFRILVTEIINNIYFETFVFINIIISCSFLILNTPFEDPNTPTKKFY